MRDWDRFGDRLEAGDATLLVLTADDPDLLRRLLPEKGLEATFVPVEPGMWTRLGVRNPKREHLPHPTSLVIAPDGTVVLREVHVNYKQRSPPATVLAVIEAHRSSGAVMATPEDVGGGPDAEPNWDAALTVSATPREGGAALDIEIAEGFHLYGAKERTARPLAARVHGHPGVVVTVPDGARTDLGGGLGESWLLPRSVRLSVDVPVGSPGAITGSLDVQVCTSSLCSRPRTVEWVVGDLGR